MIAQGTIEILWKLLPGFITAWVFYALTAHPRPSPFERTVQALIFTVLVQVLNFVARSVLLGLGRLWPIATWTDEVSLASSVLIALCLGLLMVACANNNLFYTLFSKLRITKRTSFPSEWYSAFAREKRWVVLHLKGNRRLFGWPEEWPDQPETGQFIIDQPEWLLDNGKRALVHGTARILVKAQDVEMVEFLCSDNEVTAPESEIEESKRLLLAINRKGETDGNQGPTAGPESPPASEGE